MQSRPPRVDVTGPPGADSRDRYSFKTASRRSGLSEPILSFFIPLLPFSFHVKTSCCKGEKSESGSMANMMEKLRNSHFFRLRFLFNHDGHHRSTTEDCKGALLQGFFSVALPLPPSRTYQLSALRASLTAAAGRGWRAVKLEGGRHALS